MLKSGLDVEAANQTGTPSSTATRKQQAGQKQSAPKPNQVEIGGCGMAKKETHGKKNVAPVTPFAPRVPFFLLLLHCS